MNCKNCGISGPILPVCAKSVGRGVPFYSALPLPSSLPSTTFQRGVAPARILGKIVRQLPRERRAVKIEVACLIHPVQLLGQIVLIVVALAAVGQVPVEGAVRVHSGRPHAKDECCGLTVAVLLHPDGTIIVELDDLQRAGLFFCRPGPEWGGSPAGSGSRSGCPRTLFALNAMLPDLVSFLFF